jgi:uncharacterized protein (TIGR03067 family)
MLTASLLLAAALTPADAPTPPPDAAVSDAGELQGEWEIDECVMRGVDQTGAYAKGDRWVIAGTSARLLQRQGNTYKPLTLRADPGRFPSEVTDAVPAGYERPGIYRRVGDRLVWVMDETNGRRPSSFEPAPGVTVWTLRRVRK